MKRENRILSAIITERSAYTALASIVEEADFSRIGWRLLQEAEKYYDTDTNASCVDIPTLQDGLRVRYKKQPPDHTLCPDILSDII